MGCDMCEFCARRCGCTLKPVQGDVVSEVYKNGTCIDLTHGFGCDVMDALIPVVHLALTDTSSVEVKVTSRSGMLDVLMYKNANFSISATIKRSTSMNLKKCFVDSMHAKRVNVFDETIEALCNNYGITYHPRACRHDVSLDHKTLADVYKTYSSSKNDAYRKWVYLCTVFNGFGLSVTSHNPDFFSIAFKFVDKSYNQPCICIATGKSAHVYKLDESTLVDLNSWKANGFVC